MSTLLAAFFLASGGAAEAASPTPDRPTRGYAGHLVAGGTLEVETGYLAANGGSAVPTMLKYSARDFEPRVGLDLAGFGNDAPGLFIGSKFKLMDREGTAMSLMLESALPVGAAEAWTAKAWFLLDAPLGERLGCTFNTGVDFMGGPDIYGVPLIFGLSAPLAGGFSLFGEGATELIDFRLLQDWLVDGGVQWTPTSIVVIDGAIGYEINADVLWLTAGLTVNLGSPGG